MSLFGIKEKEKISELSTQIDILQKEIIKIKDKKSELNKIIQEKDLKIEKISKSPHDRQFEKITLEFDRVNKEHASLKTSYKNLELKNLELITENNKNNDKIIEFEKLINDLREENKNLKQSETPKIIREEPKYRVLIKDLYSARKHDDFKKICETLGYIYVSELKELNFEKLVEDGLSNTKINNAKTEYIKFENNDFNSDIEEYLIYGHKVSKVFFRYRSFVSYLTEKGIKFLYQLEDFDFETLKEQNFTSIQIEKLKEKISEYNELRKI